MGREQTLNQEQRMRMERARAAQSFAQAVSNGEAPPRDRFGVAVTPGTRLLYRPNVDMIFDVVDVRPVLDPRMGPGFVTIILQASAPITCRVDQPLVSMIVVGMMPVEGAETPVDPPAAPVVDEPADPPSGLHIVPPTDEHPPSGE